MTQLQVKNGIISPKPKKVKCGFCNRIIEQKNQPHERITIKDGRPICQVCLIKRKSDYWEDIKRSGNRYEKDLKEAARRGAEQFNRKEKERIERIAGQSLETTKKE